MVGLNSERILQGLEVLFENDKINDRVVLPVSDYSKPNVSEKVLRILISYTDYVKRKVWNDYN